MSITTNTIHALDFHYNLFLTLLSQVRKFQTLLVIVSAKMLEEYAVSSTRKRLSSEYYERHGLLNDKHVMAKAFGIPFILFLF